jgi:hypothetical protein
VNKQKSHRLHVERFNLKQLNEVEGKEQYHVQAANRFAALEDFVLRWILNYIGKILERISNLHQRYSRLSRK